MKSNQICRNVFIPDVVFHCHIGRSTANEPPTKLDIKSGSFAESPYNQIRFHFSAGGCNMELIVIKNDTLNVSPNINFCTQCLCAIIQEGIKAIAADAKASQIKRQNCAFAIYGGELKSR